MQRNDWIISLAWDCCIDIQRRILASYQVEDDAHKELQVFTGNDLFFDIDEDIVEVVPFIENDAEARSKNYDAIATYTRNYVSIDEQSEASERSIAP